LRVIRVFPSLRYDAEWGVALKKHNFTIVYGENCGERWGERIIYGETILAGALRCLEVSR